MWNKVKVNYVYYYVHIYDQKPEACGQTMSPDKHISIKPKLVKNANVTFWVISKQCGVG